MIKYILIDNNNYEEYKNVIIKEVSTSDLIGFDIETEDSNAHSGIKKFRNQVEDEAQKSKKMIFDWHRTVVTGFSIYCNDSTEAYYINLHHADVENRLTWEKAKIFLDSKKPESSWVCHNAPYELTIMKNSLNFDLDNVICTLQMAVSHHGPDEFSKRTYAASGLENLKSKFSEIINTFSNVGDVLSKPQEELIGNLAGKGLGQASEEAASYPGVVTKIKYYYGLKKLVKVFLHHEMNTIATVLKDKKHMGDLTGSEVFTYGAEDAYYTVKLYHKLLDLMLNKCPSSIAPFFRTENLMTKVYSEIRQQGWRVDLTAIEKREQIERKQYAQSLRDLKRNLRVLLPFATELNSDLAKSQPWYKEKGHFYRERLTNWILSKDSEDDFAQVCQVSSAVSNNWSGHKIDALSLSHYFQARIIYYDLLGVSPIFNKGKLTSDSGARGQILDYLIGSLDTKDHIESVENFGKLASIEQRIKLYITPYQLLTDPETIRMYPEVSSMLATRRMACSNPNAMQLAKRGDSSYVRGFYIPDNEDHVLVSLDWSQIELVIIGELSKDTEFRKAYGQLPYNDLHLGAAANVLGVSEEVLKNLHQLEDSEVPQQLLISPKGEKLTKETAKKYWRGTVGKAANFEYWYSGALSNVGTTMGWNSQEMWAATERYRERFTTGENWRTSLITEAKKSGRVQLPDGHYRTRWEVTEEWKNITKQLFERYNVEALNKFAYYFIKKISNRAANQLVNAVIQGTSATLAKRSILSIRDKINLLGLRATFKAPIHDELVYSVHKDDILEFIKIAKLEMTNHPDIIKDLKLDCSCSIGLTFEPYDIVKAPIGQIELDEAPAILDFKGGEKLETKQITQVIEYLFKKRKHL